MNSKSNKVYIISGPAGVGKSTTAKALVNTFDHSAYISGDDISHMHINGREKPWESEREVALIWNNILSLTKNFINFGNNVVIDYVTFPKEALWLKHQLAEMNITVIYVVLLADKEILLARDNMRKPEYRMGERSLILAQQFLSSNIEDKHIINTSYHTDDNFTQLITEIKNNPKYCL